MYTVLEEQILTTPYNEDVDEVSAYLKDALLDTPRRGYWFEEAARTLRSLEQKIQVAEEHNEPHWSLTRTWELVSDFQMNLLCPQAEQDTAAEFEI